MSKKKMTIHRALVELKTLDKRINKEIENLSAIGIKQKDSKVNIYYDEKEFSKQVKSDYQSINDLISNRVNIKKAVVDSNSKTVVTIGGKEMTVADAITKKDISDVQLKFINKLERELNTVTGDMNKKNELVEVQAEHVSQELLKGSSEGQKKPTDTDIKKITGPFIERHKWELVDPLSLEKLIKELRKEYDEFDTEVDAVLSESNATTFIEV